MLSGDYVLSLRKNKKTKNYVSRSNDQTNEK